MHPGGRVDVLEVVDELGQVLDGVDVVVRRRRDQADARGGVAGLGDPRPHLVAGQLPALARLRALGHLDLQVVGVDQVLGGHAEPSTGDLLDRRAPRRVVQPLGVLAALAGVGLAAEAVHRDGQRLVRLGRDRAVGHGAGGEPLDDLGGRLDLVQRHRRPDPGAQLEQPAQRAGLGRPACPPWTCTRGRRRTGATRVACCSRNTVSGLNRCTSPSRRHWYSPPTSSRRCARSAALAGYAVACRAATSAGDLGQADAADGAGWCR